MTAAGLRTGDTALHIGRHFSLRDAMKWAQRMQVSDPPLKTYCNFCQRRCSVQLCGQHMTKTSRAGCRGSSVGSLHEYFCLSLSGDIVCMYNTSVMRAD